MSKSKGSLFINIFIVIICILLIINYVRLFTGPGSITFGGLLDYLKDTPSVNFTNVILDMSISGDWGLFEFLRGFINTLIAVVNLIYFLAVNLINTLSLALRIFSVLFLL